MSFDPRTNEGTTKRHVDIAYGALTAVALFTFPPAAIASSVHGWRIGSTTLHTTTTTTRQQPMTRLNAFLLTITAASIMITLGHLTSRPLVVTCHDNVCSVNSQQPD